MLNNENTPKNGPFVLFDIGGTHTRVGVSFDGQTIADSQIFNTPKDFDEGVANIFSAASVLLNGQTPSLVGGGVAGPLTRDKSAIVNAQNLLGWSGRPLKLELATKFGCEVVLENDAAMAGLGEASVGAGKDQRIVAYMTISTGVNGIRVVDRTIEPSHMGFEIGDQIIDIDSGKRHADLESLIGGAALERRYGKKPEEITDPAVWEEIAYFAAFGIVNLIVFWSPDVIVLGGSMMKKISLERVRMYVKNVLKLYPEIPLIVKSELADLGGLWGALHYLTSLQKEKAAS